MRCAILKPFRTIMGFEFPATSTIHAWVIFGGIGTIALGYAKMKEMWQPAVLGIALMVFPYFVTGTVLEWVVGSVLTGALFFTKN